MSTRRNALRLLLDKSQLKWQFERVIGAKLDKLRSVVRSYDSCVVAYSGGVDSVFLAWVAARELGHKALAVIADSPSLPRHELEEAKAIASTNGFRLKVIQTREFDNPDYTANPANRCYYCKQELFSQLLQLAEEGGYQVVVYGENASDLGDHRPGSLAARQARVRAPLRDLGFTKSEIRELSAAVGLPTADKPQLACLSSRIPHGEEVSPGKLKMVEEAEFRLHRFGFQDLRVRHHEISGGALARVELSPGDMSRLLEEKSRILIATELNQLGYQFVTVDLLGYRRGSLNVSQSVACAETGLPSTGQ